VNDIVLSFVVPLVLLLVSFLPFIVAVKRLHPHPWLILFLSVLLGWTMVGFIALLVWAIKAKPDSTRYNCVYCHKKVGLFRRYHRECHLHAAQAIDEVAELASQSALSGEGYERISSQLSRSVSENSLPSGFFKLALADGWERAVNNCIVNSVVSEEFEVKLKAFADHFGLSQDDLNRHGALKRVAMSATLREICEGKLPQKFMSEIPMPFNLQKSESLIWAFADVSYLEERVRTEYIGNYAGASIRVSKGVYFHTGGWHRYPLERVSRERVDRGLLGLTTKQIYFAGQRQSFRIPYTKIVTFQSYSDGFGICRDAANARLQIFVCGDGWFAFNLIKNLAQQEFELA
jgi:hypothetical protein